MSREELRDGYLETMREAYTPANYFERMDQLFIRDRFKFRAFETAYFRKHWWLRMRHAGFYFVGFLVVFWKLMRGVPDAKLRREYRSRLINAMWSRFNTPSIYFYYAVKCAMHYHHFKLTNDMLQDPNKVVSSFGAATQTKSQPVPMKNIVMVSSP